MSVFTDYALHVKGLDPDTYLGQLVWYTVPEDIQAKHADILAALTAVGLGTHTPRPPSDSDVFRRTASAAARKRVATHTPGVVANYLVRDPGSKDNLINRRIVRELVDAANQRLSFDEVAEVHFDRTNSGVGYSLLCDNIADADPIASDICDTIVAGYDAERGCLNGYAIRELIRRVLVDNNATNVRYPAGGVYFLSLDHAQAVAGIEDVAAALPGVNVHSLPLLDDGKQRTMLRKAFEAESVDRAQALVTEIAQLAKEASEGKKISTERYATYVTALNDLKGKMAEYTGLLQTGMTTTASSLQILQRSVIGLMAHVDHGKK